MKRANRREEFSSETEDLPEGWAEPPLDQILKSLQSGSRPKGGVRGIKEGVPSIGGEHLNENGGFSFEKIKFVPYEFFEQMTHGSIQQGDILLVKDGATTGKVALVGSHFPYSPAVVNEHVFICRPVPEVYQPFIFYFLFSKEGQNRILSNFRGSAQGGINHGFAQGTIVPLAPLSEQKRIVAKVEELLSRVNSVRERLSKVKEMLKRFRQSVLSAACSGRLTEDWRSGIDDIEQGKDLLMRICGLEAIANVPTDEDPIGATNIPPEWTWSRCEYLCEPERTITYGVIKLGKPVSNGVVTLRSSDVRWLYIDERHIKQISSEIAAKYSRTFLKGGEVVVTVRGTLGGVSVVPQHLAGANISREVAVVPIHTELHPRFFCFAIASSWSQNWLSELSKGVTYTGINIRDLKRLLLPVPPVAEQHEIVRRINSLFKLADKIEKRLETITAHAEKLTQAILGKAFRGELVPTEAELARKEGRSYEPAITLLEKIRKGKEEAIPQTRETKSVK